MAQETGKILKPLVQKQNAAKLSKVFLHDFFQVRKITVIREWCNDEKKRQFKKKTQKVNQC